MYMSPTVFVITARKNTSTLNFYRKLLQMGPLTSMDAFESSYKSTPRQISITQSPAFETIPPDILDRIAQFVDADSILPLCHSMPYYKYIATAMFDYARRFPNDGYTPYELWPNMSLPMIETPESNIIDFPVKHVRAAGVYSSITSKKGGEINVPCSKNVLNYLGALPDVVSVNPGANPHALDGPSFMNFEIEWVCVQVKVQGNPLSVSISTGSLVNPRLLQQKLYHREKIEFKF
ncbi:hypothetical protein BJ741DRAFT_650550 [Chytriomyces cf. hyalinus JEL632]|nr:hypothetical protein BJ741DRAFT_650550 [Chytriomyces cf. hyalinus JEL632]